jgi:hypothetical protein
MWSPVCNTYSPDAEQNINYELAWKTLKSEMNKLKMMLSEGDCDDANNPVYYAVLIFEEKIRQIEELTNRK